VLFSVNTRATFGYSPQKVRINRGIAGLNAAELVQPISSLPDSPRSNSRAAATARSTPASRT
jgi:hypothetical protein